MRKRSEVKRQRKGEVKKAGSLGKAKRENKEVS